MLTVPAPPGRTPVGDAHALRADELVASLRVDPSSGLDERDALQRLEQHGRNELAAAPGTPAWKRFLLQFTDLLIVILIVAAVVAFVVSGELKTPLVVLVVVLLNAVIGFVQEHRAERSLDALREMLVSQARVRRDGQLRYVDTSELVPGDIVLVEAGDRIPADGRLLTVTGLEVEEAALTGESQPVVKHAHVIDRAEVALGDRRNMTFMNTTVTRGRGELVVTATGMRTEIGRIAGLLRSTDTERTPLQAQLDGLAHSLAKLAAVIVAAVFAIGLARGEAASDLLLTAVALAVAAIPEGLPAVTAVTLALGVGKMAKRNAIVKRLASVETLGCTSVICSDKTGTLTLNEMTAVELIAQLRSHEVSGIGYDPTGEVQHLPGDDRTAIDTALEAMALCNDAEIRLDDGDWSLVGDPTEGALTVLAAKGEIDVADLRARHPRIAEVPFDSAHKYMATAHEMVTSSGERVVRLLVKGAPDVLLARSTTVIDHDGAQAPIATRRHLILEHHDRMAAQGLRVLAIAQREIDVEAWAEHQATGTDPADLVDGLTLLALAGIVDPPRPEARRAISDAHRAGIAVKMITGDHAATAAAIGHELGLAGESVTGADLDRMDDDELARRIDGITVFARVAPEHKMRLVAALQQRGNVVAMTGDGVNDAPALKKADMGVAMGITGTEVSKEAATMVLTDDNFATILTAVGEGRSIYANIVKFVRFQLSTTLGFALLFLLAAALGTAGGKPFTAIAILWVNIIMDGPPAMALGVDRASSDTMLRRPRPRTERILTRSRWTAVGISAAVMALGTLAVLEWAPGGATAAGVASVGGTMAFNTFVLFQFFNILNARHDTRSVFHRDTLGNRWLWVSLAAVVLLQVAVTHVGFMQQLFDTTSISAGQWLVCTAIASSVLWVEEARKFVVRRRSATDLSTKEITS
ncbi:MAG: HAD-IC family P-type ATPase [Actinomycetota bacterium]|nr:HAD-IC family P-type ATPase [Actinomycetota bacterium]